MNFFHTKIVLITLVLLSLIRFDIASRDNLKKSEFESLINNYNKNVIYPQALPFRGQVFRIDEGRREFSPDCREFHALLSQTVEGRMYIEEYRRNVRIAKPLAFMGAAITIGDLAWYIKDPDAPSENPLFFWGSLVLGQILNLGAGYFSSQGQIALYAAVREYNVNVLPYELSKNHYKSSTVELKLRYRF